MKVIHVLDEISKKNISLFRVVQIISKYSFLDKKFKLATENNKDKESNVIVFKNSIKNFFYFSKIFFFLKKNSPEVVHIHGLWRPIHFLFLLKCNFLNIPVVIQPHGMLLNAALKNKSTFSYLLKKIIINIYKIISQKNISFIAVTQEEKLSILKYFPKAMIDIITNPFILHHPVNENIKKQFIYFGRFNRHKNLKEFIQAYIEANLGKNWSFDIYGIDDDPDYKKELIKIASMSDNQNPIRFLKPEFNVKKKYKIISESWCNVLLSNSEVLSLSVLEACSVGTQSLVNKKIFFPHWIKQNLIRSSLENANLVANIKKIAQKSIGKLKAKKKIVKKSFQDNYLFTVQKYKYKSFLEKTLKRSSNQNVLPGLLSITANLLNSMLVPFLMVISTLFKRPDMAADIGIVPGIFLLLTQLFSGNARSLLIYNNKKNNFEETFSFRIFLGALMLLGVLSFLAILDFQEHVYFLSTLCISVFASWIIELIISTHEKHESYLFNKFYTIISAIFYLCLIVYFEFTYKYIFPLYALLQILYIVFHYNFRNLAILKIVKNFSHELKKSIALASSFFNIGAVIFWRFSLLFLLDKETVGIFFSSFAIASFPGSIFNSFISQTIVSNSFVKHFLKKYFLKFFLSVLFVIFILLYITEIYLIEHNLFTFFRYSLISLIGTVIMLLALYDRHTILYEETKNQKNIFMKDVVYGITIAPIIIIFYYLGGVTLIGFSYLASAILALLFYKRYKK